MAFDLERVKAAKNEVSPIVKDWESYLSSEEFENELEHKMYIAVRDRTDCSVTVSLHEELQRRQTKTGSTLLESVIYADNYRPLFKKVYATPSPSSKLDEIIEELGNMLVNKVREFGLTTSVKDVRDRAKRVYCSLPDGE